VTQDPRPTPTQDGDDYSNVADVNAAEIKRNGNGQSKGRGDLEKDSDRDTFKFTLTQSERTVITTL